MPSYWVVTKEVHEVAYLVVAEDEEEAAELVYEGSDKAKVEEDSFDHFLKDETTIEEVDD